MRSRLRPSPAMVVALIALFVALGGTAAALTGSNTVQSDDLGPGAQVKAADVADNAVNGADVAANSLGGTDINEATLTGNARRIDYNGPPNGVRTTIGKYGPYTLKAQCSGDPITTSLEIFVNGPAGTVDSMWSRVRNDNADEGNLSDGDLIPANTDTRILGVAVPAGNYRRIGGRSILRSGSALVQIDFEATADGQGQGNCFVYGTATRAT